MIDAEAILAGLRASSMVLLVLSYLDTKTSASVKRGTWLSFFSVLIATTAAFPSHSLFIFPSLAAGLTLGLIQASLTSVKTLPLFLSLGFSISSLFLTCAFVFSFEELSDESLLFLLIFTTGAFLSCQALAGSLVACCKIPGGIPSRQFFLLSWFRHLFNLFLLLGLATLIVLVHLQVVPNAIFLYSSLGVSLLFGFNTNFAVGFCDVCLMLPLMSSYLGFALAAFGLISRDYVIILAGTVLGNSGLVLGLRLAKVVYRNLISVMLASFSQSSPEPVSYSSWDSNETVSNQELIKQVKISSNIVVVPGYGVVQSACQGKIVEFFNLLKGTGKNLSICLHPAAGRMPGQLHWLFHEAGLDPAFVKSVEETNAKMKETDLVIAIGANDIINPAALDRSESPLAGFPVVKIWESKSSVVMLRSQSSHGFCEQELSLNEKPKVKFMYGDVNVSLLSLLREARSRKHSLVKFVPGEKYNEAAENEFMDFPKAFMSIGVPKETESLEKRVALTPSMIPKFRMLGFSVQIEKDAGKKSSFPDSDYELNGAEIVESDQVWDNDIILKVQKPSEDEIAILSSAKLLVSFVYPSKCSKFLESLSKKHKKLTYLAMDLVPKSSKAQNVDSIKLMQVVEGYRAVIEAFKFFQRCPKPMITAAGKLPPAQVLVIGTDIAGISAVSYCKSLGCITRAIDTKGMNAEEVAKLNAKLITPKQGLDADEQEDAFVELLKNAARTSDVIICSRLIKDLGKVVDDSVIGVMKPGSVIIDIYGNICTKVVKDQEVCRNGVTIIYYTDLVSRMAPQSSELYANCLYNIFVEIYDGEKLTLNELDDLVGSMFVVKQGKMLWYARPPQSPISTVLHTGTIVARLAFPVNKDKSFSFFTDLDFLWITFLLLAVFIPLSYICFDYPDWVTIMEDLLVIVLGLVIGWLVVQRTNLNFFSNLVARAAGVAGISLIVLFKIWDRTPRNEIEIMICCFYSFLAANLQGLVFGIGLKTCWKEQVASSVN